jgi:hypothetical protein
MFKSPKMEYGQTLKGDYFDCLKTDRIEIAFVDGGQKY